MRLEDQFIDEVLSRVPFGPRREQIETDLRSAIAERVEHGMSVEAAISQFGDPEALAESYLSSIPLVSAAFMSRVTAKLIDLPAALLAACITMYVGWQTFGPGSSFLAQLTGPDKHPLFIGLCIFCAIFVLPGYFVLSEALTDQTLGKKVLGIRVVRESGSRINVGQALVRQIPLVFSFFLVDALFALFTEKKQRAFELITKTRTVLVEVA
ncbi:MAG TPA: RDD family protein [Gemmatimonadaceae bacterium]|jgi:uncharacterized RDD family membrane protein YckC